MLDREEMRRLTIAISEQVCQCGHLSKVHLSSVRPGELYMCDTRGCSCKMLILPSRETAFDKSRLYVWHTPQIPSDSFYVSVASPQEAAGVIDLLAHYDAFQFEQRIKGDYSNASGLLQWDGEEWCEWRHPETDNDISECIREGGFDE